MSELGDRGQVFVEDTGVYLYTHWHATPLPGIVAGALDKEARWGDPEYLARIVFEAMVRRGGNETTGFGIGTAQHGDVWRVVRLNCDEQTVQLDESVGFGRADEPDPPVSFRRFIEMYGPDDEVTHG